MPVLLLGCDRASFVPVFEMCLACPPSGFSSQSHSMFLASTCNQQSSFWGTDDADDRVNSDEVERFRVSPRCMLPFVSNHAGYLPHCPTTVYFSAPTVVSRHHSNPNSSREACASFLKPGRCLAQSLFGDPNDGRFVSAHILNSR